jgi:hypothetical protein
MMGILVLLSILRVFKIHAMSVFKLATPLALSFVPLNPNELRLVSLTMGLALSLITIKLIVFSMAKQPYAVVQFDAIVALVVAASTYYDERWKEPGIRLVWKLACLYYLVRLLWWTHAAIGQICMRMKIELFRIKVKEA